MDPNVSTPSNVPDKRLSSSPNKQKNQSASSRQPSISAVYDTSIGSQEQIVEKAKQVRVHIFYIIFYIKNKKTKKT